MLLNQFLLLSAILFSIGVYGVIVRKNGVLVLMSIELILNAVNINLIAFWRYIRPDSPAALAFVSFVFVVAAAEAAVGLALIISVYRNTKSVDPEKLDQMKF